MAKVARVTFCLFPNHLFLTNFNDKCRKTKETQRESCHRCHYSNYCHQKLVFQLFFSLFIGHHQFIVVEFINEFICLQCFCFGEINQLTCFSCYNYLPFVFYRFGNFKNPFYASVEFFRAL